MGLNQLKGQCHEYVGHRYIKVKLTFEYLRPRCWKATNVQNIYTVYDIVRRTPVCK
jgi:hypothetical protein